MTTISINKIIPISNNVDSSTGVLGSQNGLVLTTNPLVPTNDILPFNSAADVGNYFGLASDEYTFASTYFKASTTSTLAPSFILFGAYVTDYASPYLISGIIGATVGQFTAITAGNLTLNVNGTAYNTVGIDLSTATSYSMIASLLQTELQATTGLSTVTVSYNSLVNRFIINTGATTTAQTIDFVSDSPLAALLMVRQQDGAYLSQGTLAQTPGQIMDNLYSINKNWSTFSHIPTFDNESDLYATYLALSAWTNTNGNVAYILWTNESNLTVQGATSIMTEINTEQYGQICVNYAPDYTLAAFVMGTIGAIDYTRSTITMAFKSQAGIVPTASTDAVFDVLTNLKVNFYGDVSSKASDYRFYQQGFITGEYLFIDNFINQLWLTDNIQVNIADLFVAAQKIAGSEGAAQIQSVLDDVMQSGLNNNVVQTGNSFSNVTKQVLIAQAGRDISSILTNKGYYIQALAPTQAQRTARQGGNTMIWYTNGQAVHTLPINVNLVV